MPLNVGAQFPRNPLERIAPLMPLPGNSIGFANGSLICYERRNRVLSRADMACMDVMCMDVM
jgi:hypothetical protein